MLFSTLPVYRCHKLKLKTHVPVVNISCVLQIITWRTAFKTHPAVSVGRQPRPDFTMERSHATPAEHSSGDYLKGSGHRGVRRPASARWTLQQHQTSSAGDAASTSVSGRECSLTRSSMKNRGKTGLLLHLGESGHTVIVAPLVMAKKRVP